METMKKFFYIFTLEEEDSKDLKINDIERKHNSLFIQNRIFPDLFCNFLFLQ